MTNILDLHPYRDADWDDTPGNFVRRYTWLVVAGVTLCLIASLIIRPEGEPTFHFKESGAITAMSTLLLSMSAGFSFAILALQRHKPFRVRVTWFLMTAGFVFLAFDEHAELHERIGGLLDPEVFTAAYGLPDPNDLIVIVYGMAAIPFALFAFPEITRARHTIPLFTLAMIFFVVHTAIDSIDIEDEPFWFIAEETAKIISVTLIFIAMLALLLVHVRNMQSRSR